MKFPAVSSEAVQVGVERAFAIIERHHNPPTWRYRLGVRTEDSQSSNPGSIPGSATKQSSLLRSLRRYSRKQAKLPGCCNSSGSNQGRRKTSFQKNTLLVELFSPVVEQGSV